MLKEPFLLPCIFSTTLQKRTSDSIQSGMNRDLPRRKKMADEINRDEGEIVVDLDLDDGTSVTCDFVTILNVEGRQYIALTPRSDSEDENEEIDVWFYELIGDVEDLSKEPELVYIEDDDTYEKVTDAFDEYLDGLEFDEMAKDED